RRAQRQGVRQDPEGGPELPHAGCGGRAHAHHRLLHDGLPPARNHRRRRRGRAGRVAEDGQAVEGLAMAYRVLIAQFMHETNTFSKLPTTLDDYKKRWLIEGEAMVPRFA